jgi:hypothetical protein
LKPGKYSPTLGGFRRSDGLTLYNRFTIFNFLGLVIALSTTLRDGRIVYMIITILFGGVWSSLADAMPSKIRQQSIVTGVGFSLAVGFTIFLGLFFKMIDISEVTFQLGNITFTSSSLATNCLTNWIVFGIRNVVIAILNPTCLVVIKSEVKSDRVSPTVARALYAAFHLKEAERYLQESEGGGGGTLG